MPLVLALSEGRGLGLDLRGDDRLLRRLACVGAIAFVAVEQRVAAPLVDLALLRNMVLVGATLAILIVAGTINALMYLLSLYFQNPAAFGMTALEAGLATLPAAAAMIADHAASSRRWRSGSARATRSRCGFGLAAVGFAALAFVDASWAYVVFVLPLIAIAAGLGLANGPASSASTACVDADQVGAASGISNMARYIGGSLFVAAAATIYSSVAEDHRAAGASAAAALAAGLSRASHHARDRVRRRGRARAADGPAPRRQATRDRPRRRSGGHHAHDPHPAGLHLTAAWIGRVDTVVPLG